MKEFTKGIKKWVFLALLLVLILSACQPAVPKEAPTPTPSSTPVVLESAAPNPHTNHAPFAHTDFIPPGQRC